MFSIEEEREEGQNFAFRALMLEEMGMKPLAQVFRELVEISDRKIEIFKQLNAAGQTLDVIKRKIERNNIP